MIGLGLRRLGKGKDDGGPAIVPLNRPAPKTTGKGRPRDATTTDTPRDDTNASSSFGSLGHLDDNDENEGAWAWNPQGDEEPEALD